MPGDVNLWPNLTGGEAIDLFGALRAGSTGPAAAALAVAGLALFRRRDLAA